MPLAKKKAPLRRDPAYKAEHSAKRRARAKAAGRCFICKTDPVTAGTYRGRPYATCEPCRDAAREDMRKRREATKQN